MSPKKMKSAYLALIVSVQFFSMDIAADDFATPASSNRPVISILEKRQQSVVLQQWELSCAAAALATILRYQHGIPVTEKSVALGLINRKEYLANPNLVKIRQGFSLLDLKRYVDKQGFMGKGFGQLEISDLLKFAPLIVPINRHGYPHFVVFRGATKNSVLLADPAFGNTTMSIQAFSDSWIDYANLHHVGFVVTKTGTASPPGQLSGQSLDFITSP